MPTKKSKPAITSLPEKPVNAEDASSVKGGLVRREDRPGKLAANHNQTLRRRCAR
jgi:hypothetical protein